MTCKTLQDVLFVSLLGIIIISAGLVFALSMSMPHDMGGGCPFEQTHTVCPMSVQAHMAQWGSYTLATPIEKIALVILFAIALHNLFPSAPSRDTDKRLRHRRVECSLRRAYRTPLAFAYARGIVQPRLYQ